MVERRRGKFTEILSLFMVKVAAAGGMLVLFDPKITFMIGQQSFSFGGGFSADLKGAIIASILISGWTAVKEYWLGASAPGNNRPPPVTDEPHPTEVPK